MSSLLRSFLLVSIFYLVQVNCKCSDAKAFPNNKGFRASGFRDIEVDADGALNGEASGGISVSANSSRGTNDSKVSFTLYGMTAGTGAETNKFDATAAFTESITFTEAMAEGNILSHAEGSEYSVANGVGNAEIDQGKK